MTTSFYLETSDEPCKCCGHAKHDRIGIGLSAAGWVFSLAVYPDRGLNNLSDWIARMSEPNAQIVDEYGNQHSVGAMVEKITCRSMPQNTRGEYWYHEHDAEPGPNGLARVKLGRHGVVGHGEGTWTYRIMEVDD